jgi:hypothetical protein
MRKLLVSSIAAASIAAGSLGVAAVAGLGVASAQDGSTTTTPPAAAAAAPESGRKAGRGTPVDAATQAKIDAAVTAALPGATVQRAEANSDGTYHAHVTQGDGTKVRVTLDAALAVTGTSEDAGRGGKGGGCKDGAAEGASAAQGTGEGRMRSPRGAQGGAATTPAAPTVPATPTAPANTAAA